jgi:uncharacterized protein
MTEPLTPQELDFLHATLDLARAGDTSALAERLDQGIPPNLTGPSGDTLLILAAYYSHPDTVRLLLDRGADPNRVNDRGQTALGAAVFRSDAESVQTLLAAKADKHAGERSAVEVATFFGLDDMLALL